MPKGETKMNQEERKEKIEMYGRGYELLISAAEGDPARGLDVQAFC